VLAYLAENAAAGPHGPTTVAKGLNRSSGAVGNCLVRLTDAKKVKLVTEKPRRYSRAA
jgi:energy-converting hydrogenase Eha subunit E